MRPFEAYFADVPWLGVALFQATLIATCGIVVVLSARPFRPAFRAGILLASLLGVVLVPALSLVSPVWLPLPASAAVAIGGPDQPPDPVAAPTAAETPDALDDALPEIVASENELAAPALEAAVPLANTAERPDGPAAAGPAWRWSAAEVLLCLWLLGTLAYLARAVAGLMVLYSRVWHAEPVSDFECATSGVTLRESAGIDAPLTLGLWRPTILLPATWRKWTAEQRELILAHELAHIRRRDFAAGLIAELAICLYWFHPLVRWLAARLRLEQEYAADAAVASAVPDSSPYLFCLAELALELDRGNRSLAPAFGRRRPEIIRRITMLRHASPKQPARLGRFSVAGISLAAALSYVGLAGVGYVHSADTKADDPKANPAKSDNAKPADAKAGADLYGDSLPAGAVARGGTLRYRHNTTSIAYSPDGKMLASGGNDNKIRLFDAATGKEIRRLSGHLARTYSPARDAKNANDLLVNSTGEGNVTCVAFSPDGKTLASGGWDDTVRLWDVATGKELHKIDAHKALVSTVAFSPDGKILASRGGIDGIVRLWDANTAAEIRKFEGISKANPWRFNREYQISFSPDSKNLAVGDIKVIHIYEVASGKEVQKLEGHRSCIGAVYSPDGKLIASGGIDEGKDQHSLRIWDVATGKELRQCTLPKNEPPINLAFSPKGDQLAAVIEEDDMHIFDVASGKAIHRLTHYWPSRTAFAPDGKTVVSARGPSIRLWDPANGKEKALEFAGHQSGVSSVALSPDGKLVASGGENIRLWEPATGKLVRQIKALGTQVAFSPDSKTLASVGGGTTRLWDAATGNEIKAFKGTRHMRAVTFSPDGKLLATGDEQATVRIYDLATGNQLHEMDVQSIAESLSLAFSPDNKTLACAGAWNEGGVPKGITLNLQKRVTVIGKEGFFVLLWDAATGKEVRRFGGLSDKIKSVAFSPDGKTLAAANKDGKICLWDASSGKELLYITAHPKHADNPHAATPSLAFSPDGKTLASASTDKTIRLFDVATAKETSQLQAPDSAFYSLAFGRDGKTLVTGSGDTAVLIWDLALPRKAPDKKSDPILIGD
jgi:WD40 repeat protein/beta-lactamase regulating signal transducer with metallopeptidase domain